MNRDIDIREHAIIIKFDHGHEEVKSDIHDLGVNTEGQVMRIIIRKDANDKIVRIKVQNL